MAALPLLVLRAAALAGFAIALYTLHVEHEMEKDTAYDALCDIETGPFAGASCSTVLSSPYAHILSHWGLVPLGSPWDLSNALLGAGYYAVAGLFDVLPAAAHPTSLLLAAATGSLAFSGYLAYILSTELADFCIVCCSMYVVNVIIFLAAVSLYRTVGAAAAATTAPAMSPTAGVSSKMKRLESKHH